MISKIQRLGWVSIIFVNGLAVFRIFHEKI